MTKKQVYKNRLFIFVFKFFVVTLHPNGMYRDRRYKRAGCYSRYYVYNMEIKVKDAVLAQAAQQGMDEFLAVFVDAIHDAIGGQLNADNMSLLNADQITLLAYHYLREEVMDGGFIQLIHNGLGGFIFLNPFARAIRGWGLDKLSPIINGCHKLYSKYGKDIEADCSDDAFMALFEKYPEFDRFDDAFVEEEEEFTSLVAHYVDEHIDNFAIIEE